MTTKESTNLPLPALDVLAIQRELSGLGREVLEERLLAAALASRAATARLREVEAERARRDAECQTLTASVTALQVKANGVLASHRLARVLESEPELMALMLDVAWAIDKARAKHPEGASYFALGQEVGEVGRAMEREDPKRLQDELVDVAVVVMRMLLGELDAKLAPVEPHARRPE